MSEKEYNGWSNHATWLVALHLDNDQYVYKCIRELARQSETVYGLADEIKEYAKYLVESYFEDLDNSVAGCFASDLAGSYLCDCDFVEIAKNILSENE